MGRVTKTADIRSSINSQFQNHLNLNQQKMSSTVLSSISTFATLIEKVDIPSLNPVESRLMAIALKMGTLIIDSCRIGQNIQEFRTSNTLTKEQSDQIVAIAKEFDKMGDGIGEIAKQLSLLTTEFYNTQ